MIVSVIGGGASGFFAAIRCKEIHPSYQVTIYEKSQKVLSKVKISGGGRCNVTNSERDIKQFSSNYPRGKNQLKKLFGKFGAVEVINWFENRGVPLVVQEDGCIFPKSQNSQSIIDCLIQECNRLNINIETGCGLSSFDKNENKYVLNFQNNKTLESDAVIFCLGGLPKKKQYDLFEKHGYQINPPVPSLFTFNMPGNPVCKLMGTVVDPASVKVQGTKLIDNGPLLITHWGMSGPSILKTSAWGARILEELGYHFSIHVNWLNDEKEEIVKQSLLELKEVGLEKQLKNHRLLVIPIRLWEFLLNKIEVDPTAKWKEVSKKTLNKLTEVLINDVYVVTGKTTFKEEFVTCGGISLGNIDMKTMESRLQPNIYFAGELIDIDGITGGFNFQAAWTTGFFAGELKTSSPNA